MIDDVVEDVERDSSEEVESPSTMCVYIYMSCILLKLYIFINFNFIQTLFFKLNCLMNINTHLHLIFICAYGINIDVEVSKNAETNIYGDKNADHVIRYHVKVIIEKFFKDESLAFQAQSL